MAAKQHERLASAAQSHLKLTCPLVFQTPKREICKAPLLGFGATPLPSQIRTHTHTHRWTCAYEGPAGLAAAHPRFLPAFMDAMIT